MLEAIRQAKLAAQKEEIPIGAVVVKDGEIIARAHNQKQCKNNALLHAEIVAMDKACKKLGEKYLNDCDLYVTIEPCAMCAGAIINYRVKRLFYGAKEPKFGCCGSLYNLPEDKRFNHRVKVYGGIMEDVCGLILKDFFKERRKKP